MSDPIVLSQLRHAYEQLVNGHVRDHRAFADGMIAPLIRRLEADPTTDEVLVERVAIGITTHEEGSREAADDKDLWDRCVICNKPLARAAIRAMGDKP